MLLCIDTSSRYGGAALSDTAGAVIEARLWRSTANHTAQLMPAVAELLSAREARAADLDGVAVALGPGPFSALRVGVSAAKGLAMAGGFPIVGIDTLALEAWPYLAPNAIAVAWLDAGRNEVAAGWFDANGNRVRDDEIASPEDLRRREADLRRREPGLPNETLTYCGEASDARRDTIGNPQEPGRAARAAPWTPANRLWALAAMAAQRFGRDDTDDLVALQPYYLRMPTIGVARRRDRVRQGRPSGPASQN